MAINVFTIISCTLAGLSAIFNCLGIYLLQQITTSNINQIMILINLGASEIIIAIGWLAEETCSSYGYTYDDRNLQVIWALRAGAYCFWFIDMCFMAIDRCIGCSFPLKHRGLMSKRRINRLLRLIWLLCGMNSVFLLVVDTRAYYGAYNAIVWFVFDCISVGVFIVAYASIFYHILKRKRALKLGKNAFDAQQIAANRNQQFLKIVGLITVTYLIFEVCPTTVTMIYFHSGNSIPDPLASILDLSYVMAIFIDPLIYIFLQGRVRRLLWDKLSCRKRRQLPYFSRRVAIVKPSRDFRVQNDRTSLRPVHSTRSSENEVEDTKF